MFEAKSLLSRIDNHVIHLVLCRIAGRALLATQVEIITDMIREGLLSVADADRFVAMVNGDMSELVKSASREFR